MSSVSYCRHHQFGHCKYGGHCRYEHTLETCDNFPCVDKTCDKRHPKICRYFFFSGDCKFNESCSFLHKHEHEDKDDNLKKEIEQLTKDIEVLQGEVDKLKKIFYTFSNVKKPSIEQNSDETDYSVNSKDDSNFSLNQMNHEDDTITVYPENIPQLDGRLDETVYPPDLTATHNSQQPLQCDTCHKVFQTNYEFKEHDAMEFCCDDCSICYSTQLEADLHILQVHPDDNYARDFIPESSKLIFAKQKSGAI